MSSGNRDILTVSLPICIPFISSSCPIALARNSSTVFLFSFLKSAVQISRLILSEIKMELGFGT
jgi:hypothetical protein